MAATPGRTYHGWHREVGRTGTDLAALSKGQRRFELGNAILTQEGGASSAVLSGLGNSTTRARYATANHKFHSYYVEGMAASGSSEGFYYRHYQTTAGDVTAQAARIFETVNAVAISNARGAHVSLSFVAGGKVSGEGSGVKSTLHIPSGGFAASAGTISPVVSEIWSDATDSDPANAALSCFRAVSAGNATGAADVDTDCNLFSIEGFTAAGDTTSMLSSVSLAELPTCVGVRVKIGADLYYIPAVAVAGWN